MDSDGTSRLLRILYVEDNENDFLLFRHALQKSNVARDISHFVRAEDALEALEADRSGFDVIVADQRLPGMSGLDLCTELTERNLSIPLVLLTGVGSEHLAVQALKAGVDDYLVKDLQRG
jgi:DNA-binding response OmpR family regulator